MKLFLMNYYLFMNKRLNNTCGLFLLIRRRKVRRIALENSEKEDNKFFVYWKLIVDNLDRVVSLDC